MADPDLVLRITKARQAVEQRASERARAEARHEALLEEGRAFLTNLTEQGIDPRRLDELIKEAEADLETKLSKLEADLHGQAAA